MMTVVKLRLLIHAKTPYLGKGQLHSDGLSGRLRRRAAW